MKACMTCKNKPIKNGIYRAKLAHFSERNLPKNNKCFHHKNGNKIIISKLKPNKKIFYFATNKRDFTKDIKSQLEAYGSLKNCGIAKVNKNGTAIAYLKCPQLYKNTNNNIYSRHIHFLYWDDDEKMWNKDLYTQQILCDVNEKFVKKYIKKSIIIDARKEKYYNKSHLKNSINIPYNIKWTEKSILEKLKENIKNYNGNKLIPIILYSSKKYNEADKLYKKLNNFGFYNTMKAIGNLKSLY